MEKGSKSILPYFFKQLISSALKKKVKTRKSAIIHKLNNKQSNECEKPYLFLVKNCFFKEIIQQTFRSLPSSINWVCILYMHSNEFTYLNIPSISSHVKWSWSIIACRILDTDFFNKVHTDFQMSIMGSIM